MLADHPIYQRLDYVHYLRGIAVLIVVAAHCSTIFTAETVIRQPYSTTLFRHINLIFIFISGFLFEYLLARYHYGNYLKKKFLYVILPYLVISIPAITLYLRNPFPHYAMDLSGLSNIELVLVFLTTGAHLEPLWFIPMMAIFYVSAPLFRWIAENPRYYALFPVFLIIALYTGRPDYSIGPLQNFVFYLPVYLSGIIASHFREKLLPILTKNIILINSLWIIPVLIPATAENDAAIYLSKYFFCLGILGVLYKFSSFRASHLLDKLAHMSFGIFFVHSYVVAFTHTSLTIHQPVMAIAAFTLYFGMVVITSALCVFCIQKILPNYSRLLIGS